MYEKAFEQREPFQMEYRLRRHDGEYRWVVTVGCAAIRRGRVVCRLHWHGRRHHRAEAGRRGAFHGESEIDRSARGRTDPNRPRASRRHQPTAGGGERASRLPEAESSGFSGRSRAGDRGQSANRLRNLASDIQALSHGLHPPKLELLGLEAAVAGFCEELSNRHGVTIDVHFENIPKALPPEISLCLYRVLQEALQNVVKHSGSRRAHVSLNGQVNTINLTVKDSGAGFDPHEAMRGPGLGLTSMKERLKVVGGQLSIHSQRGRGTTIHAVAPLRLPTKSANAAQSLTHRLIRTALLAELHDLRYAIRRLRNSPGFSAVAIATIALAIGANTAMFSFVNGVLLSPLPYPESDRIVRVLERLPNGGLNGISTLNYLDWTNQNTVFEYIAAEAGWRATLTGGDEPVSIRGARVSAHYFDIFGAKPALGRTFLPDEDQLGNDRVVLLSHVLWESRFGSDPAILGRNILLNGEAYTVIGVLPKGGPSIAPPPRFGNPWPSSLRT